MKKTIKYKVASPPKGIKGGYPFNQQGVDGSQYITFENPLVGAQCVYSGSDGVIVALSIEKEDSSFEFTGFALSTLISQRYEIDPTFTKAIGEFGAGSLDKYLGGLMGTYEFGQGSEKQSIYYKAANAITESMTKVMTSDESSIIDFSYQLEDSDEALSYYMTEKGAFQVRDNYFLNIYGEQPGEITYKKIFKSTAPDTVATANGIKNVDPNFSFIAFSRGEKLSTSESLDDIIASGRSFLADQSAEQASMWQEEYTVEG